MKLIIHVLSMDNNYTKVEHSIVLFTSSYDSLFLSRSLCTRCPRFKPDSITYMYVLCQNAYEFPQLFVLEWYAKTFLCVK